MTSSENVASIQLRIFIFGALSWGASYTSGGVRWRTRMFAALIAFTASR